MVDLKIILEPDELSALANGETIRRSDTLYNIQIIANPPVNTTVEEDIKLMQLRVITPNEFLAKHGYLMLDDVEHILYEDWLKSLNKDDISDPNLQNDGELQMEDNKNE